MPPIAIEAKESIKEQIRRQEKINPISLLTLN
jgi:hypothetical protein